MYLLIYLHAGRFFLGPSIIPAADDYNLIGDTLVCVSRQSKQL